MNQLKQAIKLHETAGNSALPMLGLTAAGSAGTLAGASAIQRMYDKGKAKK